MQLHTNMKIPPFLRGVSINPRERKELLELTSNWLKTHRVLQELSEDKLKKILLLELETRCRPHFIARIKQRLNRLRNEREEVEIFSTRGFSETRKNN